VFAVPGIAALVCFVLARPQEFATVLQRAPLLYIFAAMAFGGLVVDLRLRRLQPIAAPTLPWVVGLMLWATLCNAAVNGAALVPRTIELTILFVLYVTLAHGVQRLRVFQIVAATLMATCLFISAVCLHQGLSDQQCVGGEDESSGGEGTPDGRECESNEFCRTGGKPGMEYHCEHVGMFGTYTVEGRVRYRGELRDPNEVAMVLCAGGLSLALGFALRRRGAARVVWTTLAIGLVVWTVFLTQSRGGLIAMLMVPGVYVVRRWGIAAVLPVLPMVALVLALGGRGDEAAEQSTMLRYEAWRAGLDMFHGSPIFGVGTRAFTEYHFLTAHNTYVLTLAELGFVGMFLFLCVLVLSIKSLVVGVRALAAMPGSDGAQIWGMALLASSCAMAFQIHTLSFAYHSMLWVMFGMVGAWCSAVRFHVPAFRPRLTLRDLVLIGAGQATYVFVLLPAFVRSKGF
jgi:O-antigen ligase